MADNFSERDLRELAKRIAQESELGSRGEISNLLRDIAKKLDGVQTTSEDLIAQQASSSKSWDRWVEKSMTASPTRQTGNWMPDLETDTAFTKAKRGLVDSMTAMGRASKDLSGKFRDLSYSTGSFGSFLTGMVSGGALAGFANWADKSTDALRQTYDVGQTFAGSLTEINTVAGAAALPLGEFSRLIASSAPMLSALGGAEGFAGLQKSVRGNMMSIGAMGLKTDEVVELLTDYVSTQTAYGYMDNITRLRAATSFQNLIVETTALAGVTGRNRREMLKQVNDAGKNIALQAGLFQLPADQAQKVQQNLASVNAVFASFGQQSGDFLTNLMAQGAGGITTALSQQGEMLVEAGMGNFVNEVDKMGARLRSGQKISQRESLAFMENFYREAEKNLTYLQAQERTGNQSAKAMLEMYGEIRRQTRNGDFTKLRQQAIEQQKAEMRPFTRFMSNFSETVNRVTGAFKEAFFGISGEGIDDFLDSLTPSKKTLDGFITAAKLAGTTLAWITNGLTVLGTGIGAVTDFIAKMVNSVSGIFTNDAALQNTISGGINALLLTIGLGMAAFFKGGLPVLLMKATGGIVNIVAKPMVLGFARVLDTMRYQALKAGQTGGMDIPDLGRDQPGGRPTPHPTPSGRGGKLRSFGKSLVKNTKSLLSKPSVGGLMAFAAGMGLDLLTPDDMPGKDTITEMLSMGGIGAMVGSLLGPVGTLIGGGVGAVLGAIAANWGSLKGGLATFGASLGETFSSMLGELAEYPYFDTALAALTAINPLPSLMRSFTALKNGVVGVFNGLPEIFTSAFSWVQGLDIRGTITNALLSIPMPEFIRNDVMGMVDKAFTASSSAPTAPVAAPPIPTPAPPPLPLHTPSMGGQPQDNSPMEDMASLLRENNRLLAEMTRHLASIRETV